MNLSEFLVQSKINTYASENKGVILKDGSKEFIFSKDNFKYQDRYFGSDPFSGQEIIWENEKIIWSMNYYGLITKNIVSKKEITNFLKQSLREIKKSAPFRGPENFIRNDFEYINNYEGDLKIFTGKEIIKYKGEEIYKLNYHGGEM